MSTAFRHARREAIHILIVAGICMAWTIGYCGIFAYGSDEIQLLWGVPRWVIFGIALPWIAATVYSLWFSLVYMREDNE